MTINLKNLKNFGKGVKNMSPEQQVGIKISASIGTLVGFSLAFLSLLYKIAAVSFDWTQLGFVIVLLFALVLTSIQWIGLRQQKEQMNNMKKLQEKLMKGET